MIEISSRLRFVLSLSFSVDLITTIFPTVPFLSFLHSSFLSVRAASLVRYFSVSLLALFLSHRVHHYEKERDREGGGNPISLLFVRFGTGQWLEGTRTTPAELRRVRVVWRSERTPPTVAHLFFPSFLPLPQQLLPLPSFVRSPARSSVCPSSSSSLFLSLCASAYKAIPRVPPEKSRNPRCRTLGTRARCLADLE